MWAYKPIVRHDSDVIIIFTLNDMYALDVAFIDSSDQQYKQKCFQMLLSNPFTKMFRLDKNEFRSHRYYFK